MQSEYNQKATYKFPPCKPPASCADYEEYDPCELSDDITEKDLAVLLKEEKLKLQQAQFTKDEAELTKDKSELTKDEAELTKDKAEFAKDKPEEDKFKDGALSRCPNKAAYKLGYDATEEQAARKKTCKKFIKNPFYSNRLTFSTDLPPPPPTPPPQFFPPVEETSSKDKLACQKRKRKCKRGDDYYGKKGAKDGNVSSKYGHDEEDGLFSEGDKSRNTESGTGIDDEEEGRSGDEEGRNDERSNDGGNNDWGNNDERNNDEGGKKKGCVRRSDRPPCRKKVSEVSITLQPRQIPAAQKDLPPTSPKDGPEVFKQIQMACGKNCKAACGKKKCKKKPNPQ